MAMLPIKATSESQNWYRVVKSATLGSKYFSRPDCSRPGQLHFRAATTHSFYKDLKTWTILDLVPLIVTYLCNFLDGIKNG